MGGLEGIDKRVGSWELGVGSWGKKNKRKRKIKSKSPWTAFHGSLVLHDESIKENPTHFNEVDGERLSSKPMDCVPWVSCFVIL